MKTSESMWFMMQKKKTTLELANMDFPLPTCGLTSNHTKVGKKKFKSIV
jgi:hypothetical protein